MVLIIPCGLWSVLERKPAEHAKYCHCSEHYSDHLTGTAAIIATSVGTVECLIYLCRALLLWPTSGGAQLLLASFPSLWQCSSPGSPGPCCCLLTGHSTFSQSTANGSEFTCVSAILHLEPRTLVLPFFISVSQTSMVLFQGAFVWIVYPHCSAKRKWAILAALQQPSKGRCSSTDPKWEEGLCLEEWHVCARKTLLYTCPFTKGHLFKSRDSLCLSRKQGEPFTRAEAILDIPEQSSRLGLH